MEAAKQDAVVRSGRVSLDTVCRQCTPEARPDAPSPGFVALLA
jgi:hypothetical protein